MDIVTQSIGLAAASYTGATSHMAAQPSIYDQNVTVFRPGSRLVENDRGEFQVIPKTPAEVAGEYVLRPIIDAVCQLGQKIGSMWNGLSWPALPELPSLLPVASAHPTEGKGSFFL